MKVFQLIMSIALLACIAGCVLHYKTKPHVAGRLGVIVILFSCLSFAAQVIIFGLSKDGTERLVLISSGILGSIAIGWYWYGVWQRKRPDAVHIKRA